ncbi:putative DNA primase [uncultured Pleomorphomonas sp.]|uniref:Putative DNA primase n=1 Tax=uncultured Pleomorphomonas sp. TaxID=442121 RepID=A0A212L778_9HYPH|nr:toprim domain-containing protein [uncultured Pleomorphomonas sp.]SCM73432.1 putative DNA primase [uncultured Pleomorphomonas sp.]
MRGDDPEFDAWVDRARAGSFELAAQICGFKPAKGQEQRNDRAGPCPACGGTDRFAVRVDKRVFNCRHCGARGRDALSLALVGEAVSFVDACEQLTGEPRPSRTHDETPEAREARLERRRKAEAEALAAAEKQARQIEDARRRREESADYVWGDGADFLSTPVVGYFAHRGIRPLPHGVCNLRFAPDLAYWHDGRVLHRGLAMLGRIQGPDNRTIGVHRTWFDEIFSANRPKGRPDIVDPASGELLPTKKVLGSKHGGAIRLVRGLDWRGDAPTGFPGDMIPPVRLFLAEGIETLLSVYLALWCDRSPLLDRAAFWCGIDLGNLRNIKAPRPIGEVILLGDGDSDPDDTAAALDRAEESFIAQGCRVARLMADPGKDFNDMLRGEMAMPAAIRSEETYP